MNMSIFQLNYRTLIRANGLLVDNTFNHDFPSFPNPVISLHLHFLHFSIQYSAFSSFSSSVISLYFPNSLKPVNHYLIIIFCKRTRILIGNSKC